MRSDDVRTPGGQIIGVIKQVGDNFEYRDSTGRLRWVYYSASNETRDSAGKIIGKGNLLPLLTT